MFLLLFLRVGQKSGHDAEKWQQQGNIDTVSFLKDFLAEEGVIVTLQNGLPEPQIAEIVGERRVRIDEFARQPYIFIGHHL